MKYGSDLVIDFLTAAGIEHVALNPGASFRGLQDSLVQAGSPELILALHEEVAVGIAHGYAKSSGRPMAVFLHNLVGLQHASMAIFNAFVDNVPMLIVGGSGPRDAAQRRPWLDWVHTGLPQGGLVREFVKWDDEPASAAATSTSLARALRLATTRPMGPVYVAIDAALQEEEVGHLQIEVAPLPAPEPTVAPARVVERVAAALRASKRPVVLVDRPAPGAAGPLRDLAERLAAAVVDLGGRATMSSTHWADQSPRQRDVLAEADLVLALEVRDLAWGITKTDLRTRRSTRLVPDSTPVFSVGLTELQHSGFLDRESVTRDVDSIVSDVPEFLAALNSALGDLAHPRSSRQAELAAMHREHRALSWEAARAVSGETPIAPAHLAATLWEAIKDGPWQLANGLLGGWPRRLWDFEGEGSYLGRSGGEGLGYGLPASLGAALAQRDTETLVVDIQPDGDLLYTASALWTAAHHRLPLLVVMYNNRTYGKDELHQAEMAELRGRNMERVHLGIHISDPPVDFAGLARAQGVEAIGPVTEPQELAGALQDAVKVVRTERRPVLVDVVCGRSTY